MIYTLPVLIAIVAILLALVSFVQLLYLESVRLRPRDLASLSFFKETLQDRIGFEVEEGGACFSLIKHTALLLLGIFYSWQFTGGHGWSWESLFETFAMGWLTMITAAYAVPQLLYRRTRAQWLLGIAPGLRALGLIAKPFVAILRFFQ